MSGSRFALTESSHVLSKLRSEFTRFSHRLAVLSSSNFAQLVVLPSMQKRPYDVQDDLLVDVSVELGAYSVQKPAVRDRVLAELLGRCPGRCHAPGAARRWPCRGSAPNLPRSFGIVTVSCMAVSSWGSAPSTLGRFSLLWLLAALLFVRESRP